MKTPQEVFAETLKTLGFYNHKPSEMSNSDYHLCTITAMQEYAKQCCDEQKIQCAKDFSKGFNPLSTPNVVTTNTK